MNRSRPDWVLAAVRVLASVWVLASGDARSGVAKWRRSKHGGARKFTHIIVICSSFAGKLSGFVGWMPFWVALRVFTAHAGAAIPQSVPRCRQWVSYFSCSRHMFTLYLWSCTHLIGVWGIYLWLTKLLNVVKNLNANFREFLTRGFLVGAEIPMRCLVSSSISNMAAACVVMRAWGSQQAAWRPAGRPVTQLIAVYTEKCLILFLSVA